MEASKEHRMVKQNLEDFMMLIPYFEPEKISFTNDIIKQTSEILYEAKNHEIKAINLIEDAIKNLEEE